MRRGGLVILAFALALISLGACGGHEYERVRVPMDCARDGIDRKLCEFNCRNTGGTWTGTACTR